MPKRKGGGRTLMAHRRSSLLQFLSGSVQSTNFARFENASLTASSAEKIFFLAGDLGAVMLRTTSPVAVPTTTPAVMPTIIPAQVDFIFKKRTSFLSFFTVFREKRKTKRRKSVQKRKTMSAPFIMPSRTSCSTSFSSSPSDRQNDRQSTQAGNSDAQNRVHALSAASRNQRHKERHGAVQRK